MGLPVFHIKGGHHVVALKHTGEVMGKAVQQGVLARTGDKYRSKSCRFYLLQYFPSTRHTFRFRVGTEFGTFLCIDAFYHLGSGILAILALINDIDGGGSGTSLVHVCLFTAQVQAMAFHYFMPGIGMVGHGVEQYAVHVKKNCFQLDVGMPVLFQITGDRVFEHLVD